jgi:hypothetical protein
MIPIINLWNENKDNYRELLEDKFKTYITTISSDAMAASLECCMFLLALYDFTKANNILDLGSDHFVIFNGQVHDHIIGIKFRIV